MLSVADQSADIHQPVGFSVEFASHFPGWLQRSAACGGCDAQSRLWKSFAVLRSFQTDVGIV